MMSKFGFANIAHRMNSAVKNALQECAEASRDEFVSNFDNESYDGNPWAPLLARTEPPKKLDVTGRLKNNTEKSIKSVTDRRAVLENESIDARGRSYAVYQNEGTDKMAARPFMLHTSKLTDKHLKILYNHTGKAWQQA